MQSHNDEWACAENAEVMKAYQKAAVECLTALTFDGVVSSTALSGVGAPTGLALDTCRSIGRAGACAVGVAIRVGGGVYDSVVVVKVTIGGASGAS